MDSAVEEHVIYQIANAPLRLYPYPHVYVESVFPSDFYQALRRNWPRASQLVTLESTGRVPKGAYPERFIMPLRDPEIGALDESARALWSGLARWMLVSNRFLCSVIDKFEPYVRDRFGNEIDKVDFSHEVLVVRDHTNYKLGPHTDAPSKVISLLFYCPDDEAHSHLGTSIYAPVDATFRCKGGPHYLHDDFRKVATMAYKPNALFAFVKSDKSFHGVDPIRDADVLRDLILYDIRAEAAPSRPERPAGEGGSLGLRMLKNVLRGGL